MFNFNSNQKYLGEAIKSYLGADALYEQTGQCLFLLMPNSDKVQLTLSWHSDELARFIKSEKEFVEAFSGFLNEISSRITHGEVAKLRRELAEKEAIIREKEVIICDLSRYKMAYELMKHS